MAGGISPHVADVPGRSLIADGRLGTTGLLDHPGLAAVEVGA
jgi:hypothetical protein